MKTKILTVLIFVLFVLSSCGPVGPLNMDRGPIGPRGSMGSMGQRPALDIQGNEKSGGSKLYTFKNAPVQVIRSKPVSLNLPGGETHWYEAIYLPGGGINWIQAGGYLVTLHSDRENEFHKTGQL